MEEYFSKNDVRFVAVTDGIDTYGDNINKIEQVDKDIININKNFDNLYMDKINGILQEEDYIRIAKKLDLI